MARQSRSFFRSLVLLVCGGVRPGERAMNIRLLFSNLIRYQAPVSLVAQCIKQIDHPNRLRLAVRESARVVGHLNRLQAVRDLSTQLDDLAPQYRAIYWSEVAAALARSAQQPTPAK